TPLLPPGGDATSYGVTTEELNGRIALQDRIWHILSENELVQRGEPRAGDKPVEREEAVRDDEARRSDGGAIASTEAGMMEAAPQVSDSVSATKDAATAASIPRARNNPVSSLVPSRAKALAQAPFDELSAKQESAQSEQKSANVLGRVEDLKLD